ncbi:MAG: hypothetical protein FWE02_04495 [Defluviitaleaceae bacterium]|nr:hypothetical protein [Defluviitaleaceae bacterium]
MKLKKLLISIFIITFTMIFVSCVVENENSEFPTSQIHLNGQTTIGLLSIVMMYFNQVIGNISYYLDLGRKWQVTSASIQRMDEI